MKTNLRQVFTLMTFFACFSMFAQKGYWQKTNENSLRKEEKVHRSSRPETFLLYNLNMNAFKAALENAPLRGEVSGKSTLIMEFPNAKGDLEDFRVSESPIMEPGLAEKFPLIKTYKAVGIDDPTATMRFSITSQGLHTMTLSGKASATYIDPYTKNSNSYIVYDRASLGQDPQSFECLTDEGIELTSLENEVAGVANDIDDSVLRTYRLAQSCDALYGNIFATNPGTEVEDIQAQMTITINRVNEVYERDLATTLVFVENNDQIIYYGNSADDPWNGEYNDQTQIVIDNAIGSENYDIGHNFNTTGGGNAGCIACVCIDGQKGSGYTGRTDPTGDPFDIDYVAHEMGHQFGGYHTMNTCSRSGNGITEVEPASGSSIMGYAGICSTNVQSNSDAHFNYVNIRDISANIQPGGNSTCAELTPLANQPPVADAGDDYIIPISTAFVLRGQGMDPDGTESLTYNWSQNDPEQAPGNGSPQPTWAVGPLYRSILPTDSPYRYMPRLSEVVNGNLTPTWEVTPSVARTMNFSFIVRDNGSGYAEAIGQTDADLMQVTVTDEAGPFLVDSQNTSGIIWAEGETETVTWDVAGTNVAPVNATNVNILLSTNGGESFDVVLAENVPNDGSEDVIVPAVMSTDSARIMVEASGNIFYAVNTEEFSIETSEFVLNVDELEVNICQPDDAIFYFTYNTLNNFSETTTFSANDLPSGTTVNFEPATASEDGTVVEMTISNTENIDTGEYSLTIVGTSASITREADVVLHIYNSVFEPVMLISPTDDESDVGLTPTFSWEENLNAQLYVIDIAEDSDFTDILTTGTSETNLYTSEVTLDSESTYYWRVKSMNDCGESAYSETHSFSTGTCDICPSVGNTDYETSTTLVQFNEIDNASGKPSGYSDYTDISTTVLRNEAYNLTINVNTDGDFQASSKVWIDWNQNCNFDDPGEEYDLGTAASTSDGPTGNSPLSVTVPAGAVLGETMMRVSTKYTPDGPPASCQNSFDGETEDYTVIVDEELAVGTPAAVGDFSIWPNPNNGRFTIKMKSGSSEDLNVTIYDLSGRIIYQKEHQSSSGFEYSVDLQSVQSGLYMVNIQNDGKSISKKILIK